MVSTRLDVRTFPSRTFVAQFKAIACGPQSAVALNFQALELWELVSTHLLAGGRFDNIRGEAGEKFFRGRWPPYIHFTLQFSRVAMARLVVWQD